MAVKWTKSVSRKVTINMDADGACEAIVTLDEHGVTLRKAGHRKITAISYEELLNRPYVMAPLIGINR